LEIWTPPAPSFSDMADEGDDFPSRRSPSRSGSQSLGAVELKQRMVKLDGEFKGLRAQVTQIWRLLDANGVKVPQKDDSAMRNAVDALKQETRGLREEMNRHKQEMRKQQHELQQMTKELQKHAKELHLQSQLGMDHSRHATTVQAVSDDLFRFKRQIYDSGVLVPKLPVEEEAPEPPVGALDLGEDVYSARLLIRLGFMKANKDARKLALLSGEGEKGSSALEFSTDEELDFTLGEEEDLVLGLQPIEMKKGDPGYWQITTGWLLTVIFTQFLQFVALWCLLGYGIAQGSQCLREPQTGVHWWMLHLSKAAGMLAVGALMAGRIMDTVNFLMVEVLIERDASVEAIFFATFRLMEIVLIIFCNLAIFITSKTPDGVWLSITAITFVADLPESVVAMGKSGVMGHHICKQITEMQFQICLGAEYPWWFKPVRYITHVLMFGTIGAGACYAFFVPMQRCPEDFSEAPNIFLSWFQ